MKLYNVKIDTTGEELCVAARTTDHAAGVFITFWISRTGDGPGSFSIGRGAPPAYKSNFTVKTVERGDVAGVIVVQEDGSMMFEPEFA